MTPDPTLERFFSHVDRSDPDGCWPWTGGSDPDGYGHFWANGKTHRASRWIYEYFSGPLGPGNVARHTCDNPPCCRPEHLIPGSHRQNTGDMLDRGRRPASLRPPRQPGEANIKVKLTDEQVRAIRSEYAAGARQVDLATDYGVNQTTISRITRGAGWTHLT